MFDFNENDDELVDIAKTISTMPIVGEPSTTQFQCHLTPINYTLPEETIYWRFEFKTNMYRNNLRHYVKSWLYLTPDNKIIIEFTVGEWRGFMKIMSVITLNQIQNNFSKIETQLELDAYLSSFKS